MSAPTNLGALTTAASDSSKTALIDLGAASVPRHCSFAERDALTNGVARALLARGLKAGERVAIQSDNRMELLASYQGAIPGGGIPPHRPKLARPTGCLAGPGK